MQYSGIFLGIPFEEYLVGTEYRRHTVGGHMTVFKYVEVVIPKLILDEVCHHRAHQPQKPYGINRCVERQVADDVGALIILAHLIARRREEG